MNAKRGEESITWSAAKHWSDIERREFETLCKPLVDFIRKKGGAHTAVIVQWDRADLVESAIGLPFPLPD